ncbi:hypothetical protein Tco_0475657 [Tanacetum coccineum]
MVRIEYEWKPARCDLYKIFGHVHDQCPKKVTVTPPTACFPTSSSRSPIIEEDGNITMSNSYAALDDESEEEIENVYEESANLFNSTKTSESSSTFTATAG